MTKCTCRDGFVTKTCGHCCANKKPYFWTTDGGQRIYMSDKDASALVNSGGENGHIPTPTHAGVAQ